jgi:2-polyprenyl-3-methyl-5-hydroxy-6-metoxy-1,4-benzoquinol methylase
VGRDTDRDWNALAEMDPYWAVLTHDEFRGMVATDQDRLDAFLQSGREYVSHIWEVVEAALVRPFAPKRALDFGCGVGRIAIPLAERCASVLALDVADAMLARARELCEQLHVRNVRVAKSDDTLSQADGGFDLIHSFIVFQHIPAQRGLRLIRRLTELMTDDGVGVIHVLYYNPDMATLRDRLAKSAWRTARHPFRGVPQMQMNAYPLNDLLRIIQESGSRRIHVLPTDHGGCLGAILCFRRSRADQRTESAEITEKC